MLFGLAVTVTLTAQQIPEKFWNAPLAETTFFLPDVGNKYFTVAALFRNPVFRKFEQLDGTVKTSRIRSKTIKGNDVTFSIDTVCGNDRLLTLNLQLTWMADKGYVQVQSFETVDSDGARNKSARNPYMRGDEYQAWFMVLSQFFSVYFDPAELQKRALTPSPAPVTPSSAPATPSPPPVSPSANMPAKVEASPVNAGIP